MRVGKAAETDIEKVGSMREGELDQKHLLFGEDGSPNNYDLNMGLTGGGGWRTPRHRHNFDQIRYVIKGRLPYTETDFLEEGWVGYFPESVHYGPQERAEGLRTLVLQCGGASGRLPVRRPARGGERRAEQDRRIQEGHVHLHRRQRCRARPWTAPRRSSSAPGRQARVRHPALHRRHRDEPGSLRLAPPADPGVQEKWLGTFTERNCGIGFLRLDAGAVYQAGQFPSIEILFQTKGQVTAGGEKYGPETGYEFLANEGPVPLEAIEPTEFLRFVLHTF